MVRQHANRIKRIDSMAFPWQFRFIEKILTDDSESPDPDGNTSILNTAGRGVTCNSETQMKADLKQSKTEINSFTFLI